jgi:hypothetical protein
MSPTSFSDFLLYFCDRPAIGSGVSGNVENGHHGFNSHYWFIYRIAHRPVEVAQSLPIHDPLRGFAYVNTGWSRSDVTPLAGRRVRECVNPDRGERMATEPKTALAGVVGDSSFVGLGPSMVVLSVERISLSLHACDLDWGEWPVGRLPVLVRLGREKVTEVGVAVAGVSSNQRSLCDLKARREVRRFD